MKSLPLLSIAVISLLPFGLLQADEDRWEPTGPYQAAAEEAPEFAGETEDADLDFGLEEPDVDVEGAATEDDVPVGINGFEGNGR